MPQRQGNDPWPADKVWAQLDDQIWTAQLVPPDVEPDVAFAPANAYHYLALAQSTLDGAKIRHRTCQVTDEVGLIMVGLDGQHVIWPTRHPFCLVKVLRNTFPWTAGQLHLAGFAHPDTWRAWAVAPHDLSDLEIR